MRALKLLPLCSLLVFAACTGDDDPDLLITTVSPLPAATVGQSYTAPLVASGGDGAYTWSLSAGTLPTGLTVSGSAISGTPTADGTSNFTIQVVDGQEVSATKEFTLTVNVEGGGIAISTPTLPNGVLGDSYSASIVATGGTGDHTWTSTGELPPGLTLEDTTAASVSISGTPTMDGSFTFTVSVVDATAAMAQMTYTVEITPEALPLSFDPVILPQGTVGEAYSGLLTAANGTNMGYTWAVTAGELPPGIALDAAGTPSAMLSGTPTLAGTFTATVTVTDSGGGTASRGFSIDIEPGVLAILPATLPNGTVGETYSSTVTAVGGMGATYTWALAAPDTLPPGLTLTASAAAAGINGVPTSTGAYDFTITLENDVAETASVAFTVTIATPLNIVTPFLPSAQDGIAYAATITAEGGAETGYAWALTSGVLPTGLALDAAGTPSTMITGTTTQIGSYPIRIQVSDPDGRTAEASYTLEVTPPFAIVPAQIDGRPICTGDSPTTLTAVGGTGPYTWSITGGALPAGWQISTSTEATVDVYGRATVAGTSTLAVTVMDGLGAVTTQQYSITVQDDPAAQRSALVVGDLLVNNDTAVFLFDVCGDEPGPPVQISPPAPGIGDASATADNAVFSPDGTAIAFVGDFASDANFDVWLYDLAGGSTVAVNLTNFVVPNAGAQDIYWSPDSNFLAITADGLLDNQFQLFFVDVSNRGTPGQPVVISGGLQGAVFQSDVSANDVFWAPNSQGIVFHGDLDIDGVTELYYSDVSDPTAPAVGVKIHAPLAGAQDCEDDVFWAPDSSGVLFRCDIAAFDQDELWFTDFTTNATTAVRVNSAGYGAENDIGFVDYRFNDAGTMAFYVADEANDGSEELFIVSYAGGTFGAPERAIAALPADRTVSYAVWNPAGTHLAFRADVDADEVFELYIADVSGALPASPVRVTNMPAEGDVDASPTVGFGILWSNDGTRIAYVADQDVEGVDMAYVADVSGVAPFPINVISPAIADPNFDVSQMTWSPDDVWVFFRGDLAANAAFDLYATNVTGALPYVPQQVSLPLPAGGDVSGGLGAFAFRRDNLGVFFESDMIVNNDTEVWMVDFSRGFPAAPVVINPVLPGAADVNFFYVNP